jgi:hypothetical protein
MQLLEWRVRVGAASLSVTPPQPSREKQCEGGNPTAAIARRYAPAAQLVAVLPLTSGAVGGSNRNGRVRGMQRLSGSPVRQAMPLQLAYCRQRVH